MSKKKPAPSPLRQFTCRGRLTLDGVTFILSAASLEEARALAAAGTWEEWDITGAEGIDWVLRPLTVEE